MARDSEIEFIDHERCRSKYGVLELQAIRHSLQLTAVLPPWWTSAADGQAQARTGDGVEPPSSLVYASLRGSSRSWKELEARKGAALRMQCLQNGTVTVHF